MKKQYFYAFLMGMGSIFSIFHPARAIPTVGEGMKADSENLQKDMARLTQDRIKRIAGYE